MKTSAGTKRKTGSGPRQAGTRSRTPAQRKPRRRPASAATATGRRNSGPKGPRRHRAPQPASLYSKDDRNAVLLLLAPFVLLLVALGATQVLAPLDSLRRQLALLPNPQLMVEVSAAQDELASVSPKSVETTTASVEEVRFDPVTDAASAIVAAAPLQAEPPHEQVLVRLALRPHLDRCIATLKKAKPPQSNPSTASSATAFGQELARAARAQTRDLVVYSDKYRQIGFPMGDVPRFYGVCTDVVIRAYRALGIDLQVLVHRARIGTGDTSIDHRRTKTLRRFFERYGEERPITDFAEDYLPGDIVTYYRASGRSSQTHIAIVSDVIAPSGRPMIVHNRGWGPQLEDALFASDVTGHYRFDHASSSEQASNREPVLSSSALR